MSTVQTFEDKFVKETKIILYIRFLLSPTTCAWVDLTADSELTCNNMLLYLWYVMDLQVLLFFKPSKKINKFPYSTQRR
jgi:hypothetical protein